jgi:hypothetical protein
MNIRLEIGVFGVDHCALLQPWVPHAQTGLWIGVLVAGLGVYLTSLLTMERKR